MGKNETECKALGSYCILPDGRFSNVDTNACELCGGTLRYAYRWTTPTWRPSEFIETSWISPVSMTSVNTFGSRIDFGRVYNLIHDSIASIIVQKMVRDFNEEKT